MRTNDRQFAFSHCPVVVQNILGSVKLCLHRVKLTGFMIHAMSRSFNHSVCSMLP